jgi:hypothetical protein
VLHLKDLHCTKIVHILRVLRGEVVGHRRGQELAAIVPRSYCTREIGARQEESAAPKRAEQSYKRGEETTRRAVWHGTGQEPQLLN